MLTPILGAKMLRLNFSVPSTSSQPPEDITVNVISHSTAKPSTSITIPVSSPLPLQTTSSPSIDPSEVVNTSDYRDGSCTSQLYLFLSFVFLKCEEMLLTYQTHFFLQFAENEYSQQPELLAAKRQHLENGHGRYVAHEKLKSTGFLYSIKT